MVVSLAGTLFMVATSTEEARLLRFPAIHDSQVVFSYAGDLYTVHREGGTARRMTSHVGYEMFPRFSPDGKWIAFTGQYDGNTEVYLIPARGGEPKRLTHTATLGRDDVSDRMGPNNIVMTWRDSQTLVYRSRARDWNSFIGQLYYASMDGGVPRQLPLPRGGWCSFSPDGSQLAYNRVFREFRTWKRYRGGQADEVWIYDFGSKELTQVTDNPAQDIFPMWHGDRIYFISDRDENRRMNLFVHDLASGEESQLTHFEHFDIKFPSLGADAIVFENGGYLYRFDLERKETARIPVQIHEDFPSARGGLTEVSDDLTGRGIAPDGSRAVYGARGDIFTIPAKHGPTRNLTGSPGIHERNATWSPNGEWIAYVSDASGEDEIYIRPQDGSGEPTQLTSGADTYKYRLAWSPDSTKILWSDKKNRLRFLDVESKEVTQVDRSEAWEIHDYTWSPDSGWVAYTRPEVRRFPNIHLYSLETEEKVRITDGWFEVGQPEFSADGKKLFLVSDRSFKPTYGTTEWNHVYRDMQKIYLVTLAKDTPSPFAPKSDEVSLDAPEEDDEKENGEAGESDPDAEAEDDHGEHGEAEDDGDGEETEDEDEIEVIVEADGIEQRIVALPVPASRYGRLASVENKLYYRRDGKLFVYDFKKEKEIEVGEFSGYTVSHDTKKMLLWKGDSSWIIDLPTDKADPKEALDLSGIRVQLERPVEWAQIYHECWRQMRDFVYDPNLHGVDWEAMRERYEPLLAHVKHRVDLTYVIGELIGELNLGHCYVGGGDYPKPERIPLGLLGAKLARDEVSGFYRIEEILSGQNWDTRTRSPLTEIGVDVDNGDYIVAVDGKPTDRMTDIYAALVGKADRQVTLTVNDKPSADDAHDEVVVPIADEQPLYYLKWVLGNIEKVSQATDGRIGYVHIPDMGAHGLNTFAKFYYPQLHKEGLVVDVRGNGGGNVSPQIAERLRREPVFWTIARNGHVNIDPTGQVLGPKVLLLDEFSASDGDIVAYRFRKHHLGPIVGKRSWGGVVGIRGSLPLLDGGFLQRPEFSRFDLEATEWIMEGVGVEPDILVDNDPAREFAGIDDQLNRAIEVILEALQRAPVEVPNPPPYPDKTK